MRPSHDELKRLWLYAYSRSAFCEASDCLETLKTTEPRSTTYRALIVAAVIAYVRPFTNSQLAPTERIVPLRGVLPPSHLAKAHEAALRVRNKIFGHKDATPANQDERSPNVVLVYRGADFIDLHTMVVQDLEPDAQGELRELCQYFISYCEEQVKPIHAKCLAEARSRPIGQYELCVTAPPSEWLRPC